MFVRRKYQKCSCSCSIEVNLTNPDAQNAEPNQFMCWDCCWRSIFSIFFPPPSPLSPRESARCQYPPIKPQIEWGVALLFWSDQILLQPSIYPVSNIVGSSFSWLKDMESMTVPADVSFERHLRDGTWNWELCVWNALSLGQVRGFFESPSGLWRFFKLI